MPAGAKKGNNYWEFRNKHGRNHKYKPEGLWEEAIKYFKWCVKRPWHKNEAIKTGKKPGKIIEIPTAKPFTLSGFCIYADIVEDTFNNYEKNTDFIGVTKVIRNIIETQQFEGATVGAFNANIIARKLGLADKQEHTGNYNLSFDKQDKGL